MKGKEQIVNDLFNVLGDQLEGTGISLEIKQLIAEGDKVVAEMQGTSRSVSGKDYNNTYNIILTVKDGLITEMREYLDTELITEVFG
jgi:ketosteroid isomerase-like protein